MVIADEQPRAAHIGGQEALYNRCTFMMLYFEMLVSGLETRHYRGGIAGFHNKVDRLGQLYFAAAAGVMVRVLHY